MTDDATVRAQPALLTKIERESRFTRSVVVICTIANLAVYLFGMKMVYEWLPPIMLTHMMEHMPEIMMTQKSIENAQMKQHAAAPAPGGAAPAGAPAAKTK